jgi:hypothetical protein
VKRQAWAKLQPPARRLWLACGQAIAKLAGGQEDARPAALLRIGLGALVVWDIVVRLRDVTAFYTDLGSFPRSAATGGHPTFWRWSVFLLDGSRTFAIAVFAVFLPFALAMLVGYRTRVAVVASWVYLHSVQMRNLPVCDSGDTVLRVLCFFAMFVDLGGRFSADVALGRRPPAATIPSFPLRVMRFQIAFLYAVAVSWKTGPSWRDGTAVLRAMQNADFARPLATVLASHPTFCAATTYGTLLLELMFPLLALSSRSAHRAATIACGLLLHLGIFATMRVGVFSVVLPLSYLVFVDAKWLDSLPRLGRLAPTARTSPSRFPPALVVLLSLQVFLIVVDQGYTRAERTEPRGLRVEMLLSGLWQHWNVFAPDPPAMRMFFRAPGVRTDGTDVDVLTEAAPWLLPDRRFLYSRWYKYRSNLENGDPAILRPFGQYVCRRYNHDHTPKLERFTLFMRVEHMTLPGDPIPRPTEELEMLEQPCIGP